MATLTSWLDHKKNVSEEILYGDESEFAVEVGKALHDKADSDILQRAKERLKPENIGTKLPGRINADEVRSRVDGLEDTREAYQEWLHLDQENGLDILAQLGDEQSRPDENVPPDQRVRALLTRLKQAAKSFDKAYPTSSPPPAFGSYVEHGDGRPDAEVARRVETAFRYLASHEEFGVGRTTRGLYMARDLFRQLLDCEPVGVKRAHTAVLLRSTEPKSQEEFGEILWLTVELFDGDGAGFAPDPLALGLTSINKPGPGGTLLAAMDKAWSLSQVEARGYRGRWRLTNKCPAPGCLASERTVERGNILAPPHIGGGSAECAALAAILAASGMVPFPGVQHHLSETDQPAGNDDYPPLKLVPSVAVTATLNPATGVESVPPTEIPLGKVDAVDKKLRGAMQYHLDDREGSLFDTMLIAAVDKPNVQQLKAEIKQEEERARQDKRAYEGIHIVDVASVGDAMNLLLETNVWLKAWHLDHQQAWEHRWHGDTGKLAHMIAHQQPSEQQEEDEEDLVEEDSVEGDFDEDSWEE